MTALYEADARFSEAQLASGVDPAQVTATFPHVEEVGDTARPRLAALEELEARRFSRINQYRWEGGFFLVVLLVFLVLLRLLVFVVFFFFPRSFGIEDR